MKGLLWVLTLAALAVGIAVAVHYNDGYVLLIIPLIVLDMICGVRNHNEQLVYVSGGSPPHPLVANNRPFATAKRLYTGPNRTIS